MTGMIAVSASFLSDTIPLLMDFGCVSADPIEKMIDTIAATSNVHTIKLGSPRAGFEVRCRKISGRSQMEFTNRFEMGSGSMCFGLLRLIARNLLMSGVREDWCLSGARRDAAPWVW